MKTYMNKFTQIMCCASILAWLPTITWAIISPQDSFANLEQLHKEIERFSEANDHSATLRHQLESLAPDLAPNLIDLSDQPIFPHLSLNLNKHLLVSLSTKEQSNKFQYYSIKGLVHINPQWFLVGSFSSLDAVENKQTPTATVYKEKTNSLLDESNFKRIAVGFGWRPHANFLTQIQVGEDRIDTASSSKLSLKAQNQERSFAGIETVFLF